MNYYTKISSQSQIDALEAITPKSGTEYHFSLFFRSRDGAREYLLKSGKSILFFCRGMRNYIVNTGNIENIGDSFKELSYSAFLDVVKGTPHVEGVAAMEAFGDAIASLKEDCPEIFQKLADEGLITLTPSKSDCGCKKSDAWRCAVQQNLAAVACGCKCHRK